MSFWSSKATPLGNELTNISETTNSSRRPNVEGQMDAIRSAVVETLRTYARTHREREWSMNIMNLFFTMNNETRTFTTLGNSFRSAMNGIEPPYPDGDEINFIGETMQKYFSEQNLNATYNNTNTTLTINWETLPNVESSN